VGARVGVPEQEWRRAMTRAFELRVRLPAIERHRTEAAYHMAVTEDTERALAAYRAVLQLEPGNRAALNNSALILTGMARYVEAEAMARQSIAVAGASWFSYTHLLNSLSGQGRYAEADSVVREMTRLFPGNPRVTGAAAMTAYDRRDYASAESISLRHAAEFPAPLERYFAFNDLARAAAVRGRLADSERLIDSVRIAGLQMEQPSFRHHAVLQRVTNDRSYRPAPHHGTADLDSALAGLPL